ncbi:MAG: hypothetical protein QM581_15485, partial [Pseudomonas sp.]
MELKRDEWREWKNNNGHGRCGCDGVQAMPGLRGAREARTIGAGDEPGRDGTAGLAPATAESGPTSDRGARRSGPAARLAC